MKALRNMSVLLLFLFMTAFLQEDVPGDVMDCASKAGPSAVYLKDFQVKLPAATSGDRPPVYQQAVVLRGNNLYRFNLCNKQGEAVIRIFDSSRMMLTSYDQTTREDHNPIQFLCRKTGPYNIVITFKDGQAGEAIGIMSHVKINESRRY